MFSVIKPDFVYTDISEDITENDIDVVSDLWNMDGRDVYRGSRDPRYTHANVYWLYDEDLKRVGCSEHSLADHADFRLLWFRDTEFGTLFQEDGWEMGGDIWSVIPKHPFERFINEGWTSANTFLENCLHGPTRIVTPKMLLNLPKIYTCNACGRKSLKPIPGCAVREIELDFPEKEKILFVDEDMIIYIPPTNSSVWSTLRWSEHDDGSSPQQAQEQAQAPEQVQEPQEPLPGSPPPQDTR